MKKIIIICFILLFYSQSNLISQCYWYKDLSNFSINCVIVHPTNPSLIYAASQNQIIISIDGGLTWLPTNISFSLMNLAISYSSPNVLYAGSTDGRMYKTTNNTTTWSDVSTGINETSGVKAICIKPNDPNTVVITLFDGVNNAINGIYKTTNGGISWFVSNSGIGTMKNYLSLCSNPAQPNTIYAGSSFSLNPITGPCYIYKSYNFGGSWFNSSSGLGTTSTSIDIIKSLACSNADTNIILAGLYFNTSNGGPYLTTNGGASWIRRAEGLPVTATPGPKIEAVLIRSGYTTQFFLGGDTSGNMQLGGVWHTTNAGLNWLSLNSGIMDPTHIISSMVYSSSDNYLFVGVPIPSGQLSGIYDFHCEFGVKKIQGNIPSHFSLYQNYPNPFNPTTKIKFDITSNVKSEKSNVKIEVFDISGKEVATPVNEKLSPGTYEVEFDGAYYPSGVYFYKLITDNYSESKKMILLK